MIRDPIVSDKALWLMLRLAAGGFLVPHGLQKLFGILGSPGAAAMAKMFETGAGLAPGHPFVIATGLAEAIGGSLLLLGLFTRLAALVAFAVLAAAIVLVNRFAGYFWTKGGIEYPAMWALLCLCFVLRQPGPYSLDRLLAGRRATGTDR